MYIQELIKEGYLEYEAQIRILKKFKENYAIDY